MAIPKISNICDGGNNLEDDKGILQLFDDKCFKIAEKEKTTGEFCLGDFAFPTDGHSCVSLTAEMEGGELVIFDNEILTVGSPSLDLELDSVYVRGIMLKVTYPNNDDNGEEISLADKKVELWIEDAETLEFKRHPLYNLFTLFTNPVSNNPADLINRIKIVNPNDLFRVKITALMLYGKTE